MEKKLSCAVADIGDLEIWGMIVYAWIDEVASQRVEDMIVLEIKSCWIMVLAKENSAKSASPVPCIGKALLPSTQDPLSRLLAMLEVKKQLILYSRWL